MGQGADGSDSDVTDKRPAPATEAQDASTASSVDGDSGDGVGRMIDVDAIRRNPEQPRKNFDSEALEDLRRSIEQHGVLQPICVRRVGSAYEIVSGERRWRAARSAKLIRVPAIVRDDVSDDVSLELAIVENVQRADLDPLEKARGYRALMDRVGLTQEQVAERIGISRSAIANQLRLMDLPSEAQNALSEGLISAGHAKVLLGLGEVGAVKKALAQVVRKGLSVRQTEELVRSKPGGSAGESKKAAAKPKTAAWVNEMESRLREALGVKVTLRNGAGYRGSITLDYKGREELERICDQIAPKPEL